MIARSNLESLIAELNSEDPFTKMLREMNTEPKPRKTKVVDIEDTLEGLQNEINRYESLKDLADQMAAMEKQVFKFIDSDIEPAQTVYSELKIFKAPGTAERQALKLIDRKEAFIKRRDVLFRRSDHWTNFKDNLSSKELTALNEVSKGSTDEKTVLAVKRILLKYRETERRTGDKLAKERMNAVIAAI